MMKKQLLLLALLAAAVTAGAGNVVDDDEDKSEVHDGLVMNEGENDAFSMHFQVGVDVPVSVPDGMSFAPLRSWEIQWTVIQYDYTLKSTSTTFSAGLGLNWRNYTLKGHDQMFGKVNDFIAVGTPDGGIDDLASSIHTRSLVVPLLVKQRFSKNFAISLGGQLNWNFYARVVNQFENGDDKFNVDTRKIGERPVTVDILGIVHLWKLGLYCKYSPMSVLKTDRGPEFKSLAFGLYF
jgi:hypothetical protein